MFDALLQTKLYMPPQRPDWVERPHLLSRLETKRPSKLILISAPAGYGKTTLAAAWLRQVKAAGAAQICWLSLDEDDNSPQHFFRYLAAAVRPLPGVQSTLLQLLQSNPLPPPKSLMKAFIHDVVPVSAPFILVLDDYHVIESAEIDAALAILLELMPPQMTLALTSRSDPGFPISRLRARGQLIELRADDLRFSDQEAAQFLGQTMELSLTAEQIAALEQRTEGWIAGLQMAAISLQNRQGSALEEFVRTFTGSNRFVLDYLVEEVLNQQPESIQTFLLQTSVLDRFCGPLCDAVTQSSSGQETLEYLEQANLFIIPLDEERRWYRYHHLFADLLRQRFQHSLVEGDAGPAELHIRASQWYEENGLEIEAFNHAATAGDIDRAARLLEGDGMPLQFRGAIVPVLNWLASLPEEVLDARPSLWVMYASALSMADQNAQVEEKLQAAEAVIQDMPRSDKRRNLIGHIAAIRGVLAIGRRDVETIIAQSRIALENLAPDNLAVRTATTWKLGIAYQLKGDRAAAAQAFREGIAASQATGNQMIHILTTFGLAEVQQTETRLRLAAENYRRALELAGDPPPPFLCDVHRGLAAVLYQWNDLDAAEKHGRESVHLARLMDDADAPAAGEIFLARVRLARGDIQGAAKLLAQAEQFARRHHFHHRLPEIAAVQVQLLLRQGETAAAARLAEAHDISLSQARVYIAEKDPAAALAALAPVRRQVEAQNWADGRLQVMALEAVACHIQGEGDKAVRLLEEALALAAPEGYVRLFLDEGPPMKALLQEAAKQSAASDYVRQLLAAFDEAQGSETAEQPLPEPLSERELEILALIAAGLKNKEIAEQLIISLNTVLYHNKNIYGKLGVNKRALAISKARELNLIQ